MAEQELPEWLQKRYGVRTAAEMWQKNLTEGNFYWRHRRHLFGRLPHDPRCVNCHRPFAGIGNTILRRITPMLEPSTKNARYCEGCYGFLIGIPGGADIELSMLFADVRGSTAMAEQMDNQSFSRLMNRFYQTVIDVLVPADAFVDKLIGDEVTALFVPGFAGPDHARRAVRAAQDILRAVGYGGRGAPWIHVGVGVHTGHAWVGSVASAGSEITDFTALGDNVNITARLTSAAAPGEIMISEATAAAAGLDTSPLEHRELSLKGKSEPFGVFVLGVN